MELEITLKEQGKIERLTNKTDNNKSPFEDGVRDYSDEVAFTANDSFEEIMKGVATLGYDLDDMDKMRIWKAFKSAVQRKESIKIGELEAIIASEAMQVPAAYSLESYVITTGNDIDIFKWFSDRFHHFNILSPSM